MITASHNPPEYNGVKIIEPDGTEMGDEETIRLEELLSDHSIPVRPWNQVGTEVTTLHLVDEYIHAVASQFEENIGRGMTIVVDPGFWPGLPDHPGQSSRRWDAACLPSMELWMGRFRGVYRSLPRKASKGLPHWFWQVTRHSVSPMTVMRTGPCSSITKAFLWKRMMNLH